MFNKSYIATRMGMNYYHESMGYLSRTNQEIIEDLQIIDRVMDNPQDKYIKVYHNPYTNAGDISASASLAICKNITEIAKDNGYYVVWVENNDSVTLTDANWSTYSNLIVSDASEAEDSGADEFLVGNEISLHNDDGTTFQDGNLETAIKNIITACGSDFSGVYGYEEGWSKRGTWFNSGLGNVEKLYFTVYESIADFKTYASDIWDKFGNNAVIGEFAPEQTFTAGSYTEASFASEYFEKLDHLRTLGFKVVYPFSFNNEGFGFERGERYAWELLSFYNR